jgi:purine-binding chemotaxis protein CheW
MTFTSTLPKESMHPVAFALEGPKPSPRFRDRVLARAGAQDLLVVRIGLERFGVPLEAVDELVEAPRLRTVPGSPDNLLGVFTLGGAVLPLYSPEPILGVQPIGERAALVMRGGQARIALAVDDADDVVRVELADVRDAPRIGRHDDLVLGVIWRGGDLLTLLDARAIVTCCGALSTGGS